MKLIKARRTYQCNECKSKINPKDLYSKKSRTFGNPRKETIERKEDGGVAFVQHGITISVPFCQACSEGGVA